VGQPSNPRPASPHHRSFAMNISRNQADGEALAEVVNWAHGTLRQIERVESNFAASRTDRRYRTGTSMQADAELYREEAINKTLLVTANHLVTALTAHQGSEFPSVRQTCEPRSNVCADIYGSSR